MFNNIKKYDSTKIAKGSVADVAKSQNIPLAQVIMDAEAVIIVDTSGSMETTDGGMDTRYERAVSALEYYQSKIAGKILVVSFSSETEFCPNGYPSYMGGGTDMAKALEFCKSADAIKGMTFILISDGVPDSENDTLRIAKAYQNKINTVYIGSETGTGAKFLDKLSNATGGLHVANYRAMNIKGVLKEMLLLED